MLPHSSLTAKARADYEGTQWLAYDSHFCHSAEAKQLKDWSEIDPLFWMLYAFHPVQAQKPSHQPGVQDSPSDCTIPSDLTKMTSDQKGHSRYHPYECQPTCKKGSPLAARVQDVNFSIHAWGAIPTHTTSVSALYQRGKVKAEPKGGQKASFCSH